MKKLPVLQIASSLLILLFAYTAFSKLFDYRAFTQTLSESPLIHNGADTIAWLLPATELVVVLLLFFEQTRKAGLYASLVLLSVFTLYIGIMLLFVKELPCSCGGVLNKMSWKEHLFFNAGFLVINLIAIGRFQLYELLNFLRRQGMPKT
ncbi:MauE/DoxX family redox-associated membrane protein [Lacibacter sp. H375]|uniref:MauE/DoxX family redox-associated membrane protein n=1 Tax=Lacibacter sp. H375 TaxID=3133424 RepID=UPI0030BBDB6F